MFLFIVVHDETPVEGLNGVMKERLLLFFDFFVVEEMAGEHLSLGGRVGDRILELFFIFLDEIDGFFDFHIFGFFILVFSEIVDKVVADGMWWFGLWLDGVLGVEGDGMFVDGLIG